MRRKQAEVLGCAFVWKHVWHMAGCSPWIAELDMTAIEQQQHDFVQDVGRDYQS